MEQTIEEPTIHVIVTETVSGKSLITETTYNEIPVNQTSINIDDIKAKIAKIDSAIEQWNMKRRPLQLLVDKYDELNPVVIEVEVSAKE